jgi:putative phosphoribosyl transferase
MLMEDWFAQGCSVQVPAGTSILDAEMQVPEGACGMIALIHAEGRRRSNQLIQGTAEAFSRDGFATLTLNLLTEEEADIDRDSDQLLFDTGMLAERLDWTADWLLDLPETGRLPLGFFATGAAAAVMLETAAARPEGIGALVMAGTGPLPSGLKLRGIRAPTLAIAAEKDAQGIRLGRHCLDFLTVRKRLEVISDSGNLLDNALVQGKVARLACLWFEQYLS